MPERVTTSFIPKASLKTEKRRPRSQSSLGIINVIASIILLAAIIAAGGVFLFEQYTTQNIARKGESLDRARAAFEPATIKELSRLDTRLGAATALLDGHIAPSRLFNEIERETLNTVRFNDFTMAESGPGRLMITMAGEAASFNALALQSDTFGASPFFSEPLFSDFNIDERGNVVFSFSAVVNLGEIAYQANRSPSSQPLDTAPESAEVNTELETLPGDASGGAPDSGTINQEPTL
ncbi:MAG: hypothetical protein ACJKTH_01585 [Patescibacteria group bacterium UBA2163]